LKKPTLHSIVRNEVSNKATINKKIMQNPVDIFTDKYRQLRHSLMLKDVAYIIEAHIHLQENAVGPLEKYRAMFHRRVKKGQCFYRPYLGTIECSAHFSLPEENDLPIDWNESLGPIFFDYRYSKNGQITIPYF